MEYTELNTEELGSLSLAKPELIVGWEEPYTYDFLLDRINQILERNNTYSSKLFFAFGEFFTHFLVKKKSFNVKPIILEKLAR